MKCPDFIPDRLNEQPAVMRGCSWPELYSIMIKSFLFSIPISLLPAIYIDNYSSMLASLPVVLSGFFWALTKRMAGLKNGRPIGYFTVRTLLIKQRRNFGKYFVEEDGYWKISKD